MEQGFAAGRTARTGTLLTILAGISLAACNPFADPFLASCEKEIKQRLRSPSGYKRIEAMEANEVLNRAQFEKRLVEEKTTPAIQKLLLEGFDAGRSKPTNYRLLIMYDAPNAFGTPVRGGSTCEIYSRDGKPPGGSALDVLVKVDGKTRTDYLVDQVRALKK